MAVGNSTAGCSSSGPPVPSPLGITRLTGIDDSMVADAPEFSALAKDLHTFLGDAVFVAHNVSFDLRHLQAGFKAAGLHYNPAGSAPYACPGSG